MNHYSIVDKRKKVFSLALLISLSISLFGGRWAAYIGIPGTSIFFCDLVFVTASLYFLPAIKLKSSDALIWAILIPYISFSYLQNPQFSSITKIRDLIPYIYLMFVPLLREPLEILGLPRILKYLKYSTLGHGLWCILASLNVLKPIQLGGIFMAPVFSTRWDHSGFVLAIGFVTWYLSGSKKIMRTLAALTILLAAAVLQGSRAGLLASLFGLFSIFWQYFFRNGRVSIWRTEDQIKVIPRLIAVICISVLLLPIISSFLPESSSLSRIGLVQISDSAIAGGEGTARGRRNGQQLLLEWVRERKQTLFGVGPGVEMVADSGAVKYLSGALDVRSPHSWPYGSLARFGYIGSVLWAFILILARYPQRDFLKVFDFPISPIVALLITSLFGVMIESPFGSMPLAFLLAMPTNRGDRTKN